jgi:hypothetical protein
VAASVGAAALKGASTATAVTGGAIGTGIGIAALASGESLLTSLGMATAAATSATVAAEAGAAIGIGAAIGNAIPIPLLGAAIGAVIGAFTALGVWLGSATKDTFHPSPLEAEAWLTIFRINPCLLFSGVDNATNVTQAARLVRYFKIVAGEVKTGAKGNTGELYNPVSNDSCSNAYMCQVDPDDVLTDPAYLTQVQLQCQRARADLGRWFDHGMWYDTREGRFAARMGGKTFALGSTNWIVNADGSLTPSNTFATDPLPLAPVANKTITVTDNNGQPRTGRPLSSYDRTPLTGAPSATSNTGWKGRPSIITDDGHLLQMQIESDFVPTAVATPAQAKSVLTVLRAVLAKSNIGAWSEFDKNGVRNDLRTVRALAGETGPDPVLGPLVGGDVSVTPAAKAAAAKVAPNAPWLAASSSDAMWWGAGIAILLLAVGGLYVVKRRSARINALGTSSVPKSLETPGDVSFREVLFDGVMDGELTYPRSGMRSMLYFDKAFGDARLLGISPTELAVSGRYFGEEPLPIRIEIHADGSKHLKDGRHRYTAAKQAGASSILADVVLFDMVGDTIAERLKPIRLV